jgi:hypothetical protein
MNENEKDRGPSLSINKANQMNGNKIECKRNKLIHIHPWGVLLHTLLALWDLAGAQGFLLIRR